MADYTRVYIGADGLSHFEDLDFEYAESFGTQTPAAGGVEAAGVSLGTVLGAVFRSEKLPTPLPATANLRA